MPEFKPGDRVRIKGHPPETGTGTVSATYLDRPEVADVWFDDSGIIQGHLFIDLERAN
ncbi:hypothetical protein SEA_MOOSEHEAD_34 [Gordonia phage Moosehead]|nr:hypothetical protein SEA_MOOSEHEAD_34 [Gordonia phage Moosehead]